MQSYDQYCPIARASEVLGDRWTLLILREMLIGAGGFNELQRGLPGISRSVLRDRLRSLERSGVVSRQTGSSGTTARYALTPAGRDLMPVIKSLGDWGATWSFTDPRPDEIDPDLLIVWIARHVDRASLPAERTVVQFNLIAPAHRYWMVLEPHDVSVCLRHPGFDIDLDVTARTLDLYAVYSGRTKSEDPVASGRLSIDGPSHLQRQFASWFTWSPFADAARHAGERREAATHLPEQPQVRVAE